MKVIELTKGQVAILDDEDFERIAQWRWHVDKNGYAVRKNYNADGTKSHWLMHRIVMNAPKGQKFDHKNMNVLDNRKQNLRPCTNAQNRCNTHVHRTNKLGVKGVCYRHAMRHSKPYNAQITSKGHTTNLGYYATAEEAHAVYCESAKKLHGEFARFN